MIHIHEGCEYTILIADLIETLSELTKFKVLIWITGTEIPYGFDQTKDFEFLQEGLKVSGNESIEYIFYDTITSIKVKVRK